MLYTTYFAAVKRLPATVTPVAICRQVPPWWDGLVYEPLAPKVPDFKEFKSTGNVERFINNYVEHNLSGVTQRKVVDDLKSIAGPGDIALVCFEAADKFCHRHVVGWWLEKNGFLCPEYDKVLEMRESAS